VSLFRLIRIVLAYDYRHPNVTVSVEYYYVFVTQSHATFAATGTYAFRENGAVNAYVIET
jgi:hypothetical protein